MDQPTCEIKERAHDESLIRTKERINCWGRRGRNLLRRKGRKLPDEEDEEILIDEEEETLEEQKDHGRRRRRRIGNPRERIVRVKRNPRRINTWRDINLLVGALGQHGAHEIIRLSLVVLQSLVSVQKQLQDR